MHSLNPFLRAFFRSNLPAQCNPVNQHILLVPTTECLLTSRDRETGAVLADICGTDEFLGSHILRVSETTSSGPNKELGNVRDNRGKAKPFSTVNGRMVVVKESFVYTNKGFRNLNQVQLLSDSLYYHDSLDAQQWLIYYISKPLLGSIEPIKITPATLPELVAKANNKSASTATSTSDGASANETSTGPEKKDVKSFNELLNNFPMIARQMQQGLEQVFKDFNRDISKPLPSPHSKPTSFSLRRSSTASSRSSANGSMHSRFSTRFSKAASTATTYADDEEDHMRKTLETAVTAAIDLFQMVDKQQLSLLGATTDLTGPLVERIIERYVAEQLHTNAIFPRLCEVRKLDDLELETCIHHMKDIDIAQVGIDIDDGREGKQELTNRLRRGIEEFKKLGVAGSPQEMMDILLATQKTITTAGNGTTRGSDGNNGSISEKPHSMLTMNADTLVSLLLVVVIRSQVRHLQARLAYMRGFIFIDDVESGEMGYALSTFEAVLAYLASDPGGLKIASRRNKRLWQATKKGSVSEMKAILEPNEGSLSDESESAFGLQDEDVNSLIGTDGMMENQDPKQSGHEVPNGLSEPTSTKSTGSDGTNLAHVFPFQSELRAEVKGDIAPRSIKRVSLDLRSLSNSSEFSFKSRTETLDSQTGAIEGDTSIAKLCQTEDSSGDSVLMMAVEARQPGALDYLLSLSEYYPLDVILQDVNSEGTTLLSAAIQLAHSDLIDVLVDCISQIQDTRVLRGYLAKTDKRGRAMAHYLFNAPRLIKKFGTLLPWRLHDKMGQTPLLALCRSYDHPHYTEMVNDALECALEEQDDDDALHLDHHVDARGNTLLHVVSEPYLALRILQHCDVDPNAPNNRQFTPLMVASKFGRFDLIRALFLDRRVDVQAREARGMTAVELAKDDEVRNRIDDMVLVSNPPAPDGRVTAVVRSFFVEDATIRLIIKSAARSGNGMIAITTCRRSLSDFEKLAKWLTIEHPASWIPSNFNFRSPFQIPSKPSRAVLHDIQLRLNKFLRTMLTHSTFSAHELLWEFILAPEIQPEMMAERSLKKADISSERIKDEYEPVEDVRDVETFVAHARESLRGVNHSTKSTVRRVNNIRNAQTDFFTSLSMLHTTISTIPFLPPSYLTALSLYNSTLTPSPSSDPYTHLHTTLISVQTTILAILSSLSRPSTLISTLTSIHKQMERQQSAIRRSDRWPAFAGLLDDAKSRVQGEGTEKLEELRKEKREVGQELRYAQGVVAQELAGWWDGHGKGVKAGVRDLVRGVLGRERERLEGMKRALRVLREGDGGSKGY